MADILKMAYSDMDMLSEAFKNTASEINDITANVFLLMADIDHVMGKDWEKQIAENTRMSENIISSVEQIVSMIGYSWQGDKYQDFIENTYPSVKAVLDTIRNEMTNFQNTIILMSEKLHDDLSPFIQKVSVQKTECERIALWIHNYMLEHFGVEMGYSEAQIDSMIESGSLESVIQEQLKYPESLLTAAKEVKDKYGKPQSAANFDGLSDFVSSGDPIKQGSSYIYNIHTTKNADGSGNISFTCSNSTKRITEITVYDAKGNVISCEHMDGQEDPSTISGTFKGAVDGVKDMVNGKFAKYDADFSNSKKEYSLNIPEGGYVRITDDASLMNADSYIQKKGVEALVDHADKIAGVKSPSSTIGKFGYGAVKTVLKQNAKDELNGSHTDIGGYVSKVGENIINTGVDVAADSMLKVSGASPAGAGIKVVEGTLKVNKGLEKEVQIHQEEKTKGNGALYICV